MDDLFTFFCTNGTTKRLWKQLADRIGNTQEGFETDKEGYQKSFHRIRRCAPHFGPWDAEAKVCGIMHTCLQVVQHGSMVRLNPYHK